MVGHPTNRTVTWKEGKHISSECRLSRQVAHISGTWTSLTVIMTDLLTSRNLALTSLV